MNSDLYDASILEELVRTRMPYGRYQDYLLCDLPEPYLVWFHYRGFPPGRLGTLLGALYEIKLNGLEFLLKPLKPKE
jgi:uncharacterized protein